MSTAELSEELERTILEHDLSDDHAARTRELVEEGMPILDAIKQAGEEERPKEPAAAATDDPAQGLEEPTEAMLRAMHRENVRHSENVHEIMGSFAEGFDTCHTCDGLGLEAPGPKPQPHPFFAACATCAGYGQVLTGSLAGENTSRDCPDCGGRGYLELLVDNTPAVELIKGLREQRRALQPQEPPPPPVVTGEGQDVALEMGRPAWMGDPDIGG